MSIQSKASEIDVAKRARSIPAAVSPAALKTNGPSSKAVGPGVTALSAIGNAKGNPKKATDPMTRLTKPGTGIADIRASPTEIMSIAISKIGA